jgi:hypothetical protein
MSERNRRSAPPSEAEPALRTGAEGSAATDLAQIGSAVSAARTTQPGTPPPINSTQFLVALALLRGLREHLAGWEPELIDAARAHGASWADLAPALGVASRQAAERRALRLRPGDNAAAATGDQRVSAERDRRAGQRAVNTWARHNAADLRQLAGQISALTDLPTNAAADLDALRTALGQHDPATLLTPLADTRPHLAANHPTLTEQLDTLDANTASVRRRSTAQRHTGAH